MVEKKRKREWGREESAADSGAARGDEREPDLFERAENLLFLNYRRAKIF